MISDDIEITTYNGAETYDIHLVRGVSKAEACAKPAVPISQQQKIQPTQRTLLKLKNLLLARSPESTNADTSASADYSALVVGKAKSKQEKHRAANGNS